MVGQSAGAEETDFDERLAMKMTDDKALYMRCWAEMDLPARLNVERTATVLGFADHEIPILVAARKLTPLGDPAPNAPKWFSALEVIRLSLDEDWLNKATREVSRYWKHKRERSGGPRAASEQRDQPRSTSEKSLPRSPLAETGQARR